MILASIFFYGSLVGIAVLAYAKWREAQGAPWSLLRRLNTACEPTIAAIVAAVAAFYRAHVNMMRVKLVIASLVVAVESINRDFRTELRRLYFALTHKVRTTRSGGQKMAVSFFLKDIAEYKSRLTEGRQR